MRGSSNRRGGWRPKAWWQQEDPRGRQRERKKNCWLAARQKGYKTGLDREESSPGEDPWQPGSPKLLSSAPPWLLAARSAEKDREGTRPLSLPQTEGSD